MLKEIQKDKLLCKIYESRAKTGVNAAKEVHDKIIELLDGRDDINMIFAAAPSQNEVLEALVQYSDIPWERINAFHMDEYIGLQDGAEQSFGVFLKNRIFDRVPFKNVFLINGNAASIEAECDRYSKLLKTYPVDIVCLGIGENGHIAFNDPGVADFNDKLLIKTAELDNVCRNQQVNDGCFKTIEDVPTHALTLTIPALVSAKYMFCVVPAVTKAEAVRATMTGEITDKCPATAMRFHDNAILYCDADSGKYLL